MRFKGRKVWVALDPKGRPLRRNGKVLVKYQLQQDHQYWVHEKNVTSLLASEQDRRGEGPERGDSSYSRHPESQSRETSRDAIPPDAVVIFTDGASSGNPGPSGIGVVLRHKGYEKEISHFIGTTTNNVAELTAIKTALLEVKKKELPVRIFTDSTYALGVLSLGWKAKKNQALIRSVKTLMAEFKDLKIIHVKGHEGDEGNERANRLAVCASKSRKNEG